LRITAVAAMIALLALVPLTAPARAAGAFVDEADGYALTPPPGWTFDGSLLPDVARWNTAEASLRVFMQPVADRAAAETYVAYSNRSVDGQWNGIELQASTRSGDTWFRQWLRPPMALLQPDMRQYAEWDEIFSPTQVLTVMVNATPAAFPAALVAAERVFASVLPAPWQGSNAFAIPHAAARAAPLVPPAGAPLRWGLYEPRLDPGNPGGMTPLWVREAQLGGPVDVVMVYLGLGRPFPSQLVRQAAAQGQVVEVTLQTWAPAADSAAARAVPYQEGTSQDAAILNGQDDAYLRRFAREAAAAGVPFFLRFDNEMNGDWDPWSAFQWGKDTDIYVATWRHVASILRQAGAGNAALVWNPNNDNLPAYRWNDAPLYYPGDAYVDWVGLTAYNLGTGQPGSAWRSFDQAFGPAYARDQLLYPGKPLIITEFASNDQGGDKAAWIRDMFAALPRYPAIRYAVWWDADQGSLDYALDRPPAALDAFRAGLRAAGQ
jgi:mannan endo-1,4-beta-mannosidase